jgi:hypothetical protein
MAPHETAGIALSRDLRFAGRRRRSVWSAPVVLVLLLGCVAGAVWLHARLSGAPLWAVRSIVVQGNRSIEMRELLDRLRLRPGMPWWRVQSRAAALRAAEPRLADVEVHWRWPRDLVVRVRERQGFLRLVSDPPLEVASDGVIYRWDEDLDPLDEPLLTGALPANLGSRRKLRLEEAGGVWAEFLDLAREAPGLWKEVSEIHYAGGRDFQIFLRGGHRVLLWEMGINHKLKQTLPDVLKDLDQRGLEDVVVDLRFADQVVLRLPEAAPPDSGATPRAAQAARTAPAKSPTQGVKDIRALRSHRRFPRRPEHGRRPA